MTPSQKILSENRNNDAAIERLSEALDDMAIALSAAQRAEVAPLGTAIEKAILSIHPKMNYSGESVLLILRSCKSLADFERTPMNHNEGRST